MNAPRNSIFISYRRVDSVYAVDQLDERLKRAFGEESVFRDASSIEPGAVFPQSIRDALAVARVTLVVIGPGWLRATSDPNNLHSPRRLDDPADWVRLEIETLLTRGEGVSVIPVLLGGVSVPKIADLPASLQALTNRNGMMLPPYPNFADSLRQIIEAVAKLLKVTPQPVETISPAAEGKPPRFGGNSFSVTGKKFVGREQELHLLDEAWGRSKKEDKINIVSLIGQGGEGKSALVLEWQARRARRGWKGARRVFVWSFYSQGTSAQSSASADDFFSAAFAWFDPAVEVPKDSTTKGAKLAELIATERSLLVLDGLEPLQQPPGGFGGEFKDPAMKALLRGLALHNPGLCVITSRTDITDISAYEHADGSCQRHRLHSLDPVAARALLRELGVLGPDRELDAAAAWFHRHAYDLNLLGNYLRECTDDHDIRGWEQRFPILKEDENIHPVPDAQGKRAGHGVRMLRACERWLGADNPALAILRLLGLFDRPVRSDLLDELRAAPVIPSLTETLVALPEADWKRALAQLEQLALIHREPLFLPAGKAEVKPVTVSADEVSDEWIDGQLEDTNLPEHIKKMSRAEFKQLIARGQAAKKNKFAKSAERPRRAVTFALDTHPLLREHFGAELRAAHEAGRREGHRRLFTYLYATTPDQPDATLEDLQPLYHAVAHGCQAGLQQEACDKVYGDRIQRGQESYSMRKLGAFGSDLGAVACFFETPWKRVSSALNKNGQAVLLNQAAFSLRALGRLTEALEPMRAGLETTVKQQNWKIAAVSAGNLSELELTLGVVAGAVGNAEQSVTYADRSGDAFQRMSKRTTHADALYQAGRRAEAEARFREAEQMQAKRQPAYPLLYSIGGFRYCDLLLTEAERAAWHICMGSAGFQPVVSGILPATGERAVTGSRPAAHEDTPRRAAQDARRSAQDARALLMQTCRAVSERVAKMLEWRVPADSLLDIALDHLTLGHAALYEAVLGKPEIRNLKSEIEFAVSGLRRYGAVEFLVRALLTRAWLRSLTGLRTGPETAQSDLDEAWEIAARGPMPLFLADIHLHRARLFGSGKEEGEMKKYPWKSMQHDLAEARRLIEKHGYWRRKQELEDAEAALIYD